jgi:S-DNA-T family DNA segregation ATPase FtsK/SpoIIIE
MLVAPGGKPNPKRVQGAFVSEAETESVVDFIKAQVDGESYDEQALEDMKRAAQKCDKSKDEDDGDEGDEESSVGFLHDRKFLNAVELAIRNGSVATSFLQRKLKIGYGKAAQYIDTMEDLGLVSEKNGSKPRDILVSIQEWQEKLARLTNT